MAGHPAPARPQVAGLRRLAWIAAALTALLSPAAATAGAWPLAPGETQVIVKYEQFDADRAWDEKGVLRDIPRRSDAWASVFVERGITDRLTFQGRAGWTRGSDLFVDYQGRGPIEAGLRWAVRRDPRSPISLYLGVVSPGEGRNAGYAAPGAGDGDVEARALAGRAFTLWRRPAFVDVQGAFIARSGLPDEARFDTTVGVTVARGWQVLAQTYSGRAFGREVQPTWLTGEVSVVRDLGPHFRLQAGWRASIAGREAPMGQGPVVALWARF